MASTDTQRSPWKPYCYVTHDRRSKRAVSSKFELQNPKTPSTASEDSLLDKTLSLPLPVYLPPATSGAWNDSCDALIMRLWFKVYTEGAQQPVRGIHGPGSVLYVTGSSRGNFRRQVVTVRQQQLGCLDLCPKNGAEIRVTPTAPKESRSKISPTSQSPHSEEISFFLKETIRTRGHRHASAKKIPISQPPDLTPPNEPPSSPPQRPSIPHADSISTEGLPSPSLPPGDTTFQRPLDATSMISEQPNSEDEGFFSGDSDYTLRDTEDEGDWENGRLYASGGKYHFPVDELQQEIESLMHHVWTQFSPVGQDLFLAPVNTPNMLNVLDIGSGPCYWVDDFADKYVHTTVTAVDLFRKRGLVSEPNVKLWTDDVELSWPAQNKYEFIHSRAMALAIRDWDMLLRRAFQSLVPGGFLELQEIHYSPQSENGSPHSTAKTLAKFFSKIAEGLKALGVDLHAITLLADKIRAAGFVNVTTNISYISISRNAQIENEKDAGTCMKSAIYTGLQGTALGPLTRGLGWSREEVEVYLAGVRDCLRPDLQDTKLPMYIIHAQRPLSSLSDERHRNMRTGNGPGPNILN
ncbi:hypothetical protein V493_03360 [Pseudogymnoascus sp. VKM F-4281 (FW-2241)]|nr:hypothetical protein V493_03360 [Pseudogymnoascus sp. VKM F-4281 (FW-2241)]